MRTEDPNRPMSFAGTLTVDNDDDNEDQINATNTNTAAPTATATTAATAATAASTTNISPALTPTETFTNPSMWSIHLQRCADEAHALLNNLRLQERLNRVDPELDEAQQPLQSYDHEAFHGDKPSRIYNL